MRQRRLKGWPNDYINSYTAKQNLSRFLTLITTLNISV